MAYGLICHGGGAMPLKKLECTASVTDRFGVYTLHQQYSNRSDDTVFAEYIFPTTDSMVVLQFSASTMRGTITSKIVPKKQEKGTADCWFAIEIGKIGPRETVDITIKYLWEAALDGEKIRISIPTFVEQKLALSGDQFTFDSYENAEQFTVNLDLSYYNYKISKIVSPTDKITVKNYGNHASIKMENVVSTSSNIILDVYTREYNSPKVFRHDKIIACSFKPEIELYSRRRREYLFMLDMTDTEGGWKLEQVKTAIALCVRGLQRGDRFNILLMKQQPVQFCDDFLPVTDETLKVLDDWLLRLDMTDTPDFFRPVIAAYKLQTRCTAVLLSDGGAAWSQNVLEYIRNHSGITFYTVSMQEGQHEEYLRRLSAITGGQMQSVDISQRIDDAFITFFNTISSPVISNVGFAFDEPVSNITPGAVWSVRNGDMVTVTAQAEDVMPSTLKVKGGLSDTELELEISLDNCIEGGEELSYLHIKQQADELIQSLSYDGSRKDEVLLEKLTALCIKHQFYCKFVSYEALDGWSGEIKTIDMEQSNAVPGEWYQPVDKAVPVHLIRVKDDDYFVDMAKNQCANGSFRPRYMTEGEDVTEVTAQVLLDYMTRCPKVERFIWQLRKTVIYLLECIEDGDDAQPPQVFTDGISRWYDKFGGNDKISQKAAVLEFLYMGK